MAAADWGEAVSLGCVGRCWSGWATVSLIDPVQSDPHCNRIDTSSIQSSDPARAADRSEVRRQ